MSNIDVTRQIMRNYQLGDAALASEWGSDVKSKMGIGSTLGGLIGKYGVPALAGALMSTGVGAPLGIALSIAGAAGGSYLGSTIGRELAGDADKGMGTQTNALRRLDSMFDDTRDSGALIAGATAGASALSMGADKYMAHLKNPFNFTSTVGKIKADPSLGVTFTPTTMTSGYTPPSILNTQSSLSQAPLNLVTPPAVSLGGAGNITAPLGNVAGGGQLGLNIGTNPSLLNYVPNLGGLNVGGTGIAPNANPLLNQPLIGTGNLLNLPSTRINPYPMYQPITGPT
jgi:hypothetical protein